MNKTCSKCGEEKSLDSFYRDKRWKGGPRAYCKACSNATSSKWRKKNEEKNREYLRAYYEANLEALKEYNARYRQANLDILREKAREWRRANPDFARTATAKRRARKLAYGGEAYSHADVVTLLKDQNGRCVYCDVSLDEMFHVDHVTPLSRGGGNGADNIALACPRCNRSKGNRLLWTEWVPKKEKASE